MYETADSFADEPLSKLPEGIQISNVGPIQGEIGNSRLKVIEDARQAIEGAHCRTGMPCSELLTIYSEAFFSPAKDTGEIGENDASDFALIQARGSNPSLLGKPKGKKGGESIFAIVVATPSWYEGQDSPTNGLDVDTIFEIRRARDGGYEFKLPDTNRLTQILFSLPEEYHEPFWAYIGQVVSKYLSPDLVAELRKGVNLQLYELKESEKSKPVAEIGVNKVNQIRLRMIRSLQPNLPPSLPDRLKALGKLKFQQLKNSVGRKARGFERVVRKKEGSLNGVRRRRVPSGAAV